MTWIASNFQKFHDAIEEYRINTSSEHLLLTTFLFVVLIVNLILVFIISHDLFKLIVGIALITKQGTCCTRGNI